ncbi:MAG: Hsp20/alpha crystallin family protein [Planctomycetes bacterium]|nr:Hsp20/alpha crystallin family protein [Planctomycetota bacterium]
MNLIPWRRKREELSGRAEPENALAHFRNEMDTLFDRFFRNPWGRAEFDLPLGGLTAPSMDLADTDNEVTVTLELPGVQPDDVDIRISGGLLTISGEKREEKEKENKDYHFTERRFGSFRRSVELPSTVDPEKVEATFKNGVLAVAIAKRPDAKPKRIEVRKA